LRLVVELFASLVIALALGLASAWYMVDGPRIGVDVGAWTAVPSIAADSADPYSRARVARSGEIAMGAGEGLVFVAANDDEGRSLGGDCDYVLSGETPTARLWTLTVSDAAGRLPRAASGRTFLTSREILRDIDGRFEIAVSANARPGNWLPAPAEGALRLTLRLYDTPLALSPGADMVMPHVERRGCR
jgi:hypothetical protein